MSTAARWLTSPLVLFLVVFGVYQLNVVDSTRNDPALTPFSAASLVHDGDLDLSEYPADVFIERPVVITGSEPGATFTSAPSRRPSLTRTGPHGVATGTCSRASTRRWTSRCRRPSVVVSRKTSAARASRRSGEHSTCSTKPGRPFFIRVGVSVQSRAPAASRARLRRSFCAFRSAISGFARRSRAVTHRLVPAAIAALSRISA